VAAKRDSSENAKGLQELTRILETAVTEGADSVELEFASGGGLEVTYWFGDTGFGSLLVDRTSYEALLGCIVAKAKLQRRVRGKMAVTVHGKELAIEVVEYDSFGESAFRSKIKKPGAGPTKGS